uniref:Uncharacterized protein n=1 Tax=Avena sativa TaxID=4498 RepID=A0ACD5YN87_AVESA
MGSSFSCAAVAVSSAIAAAALLKGRQGGTSHQRWLDEYERKYPHRVVRADSMPTKEERDASMARPHVHSALRHYNSINPGAEYDAVKPLKSSRVGFRDEIWIHVNFLARRRGAPPDAPEQRFFAEIHYDRLNTPFVETCTILENPLQRFKKDCSFCDGSYGIFHPSDAEFICGKKHQKKERFRTRSVYQWRFDDLPLDS